MSDMYDVIDQEWAQVKPLPSMSADEAIAATKKLWRKFGGKSKRLQIIIGSGCGRKSNWVQWSRKPDKQGYYHRVWVVSPKPGWEQLVHHLSHWLHYKTHKSNIGRDHGIDHRDLELRMGRYVRESGWLQGALKKEPKPKPNVREGRYRSVCARLARFQARIKRDQKAAAKLARKKAYYEQTGVGGAAS